MPAPSVLLRLRLSRLRLLIGLECRQWLNSVLSTLCRSRDNNPHPQVWDDTELEEASSLEKFRCVSLFFEDIKRLLTGLPPLKWRWHSVHHICSWTTYHSTTFFFYCFPHVNLLLWGSWVTTCPKGIHYLTMCHCEVLSMPPRKARSNPFKVEPPRGVKKSRKVKATASPTKVLPARNAKSRHQIIQREYHKNYIFSTDTWPFFHSAQQE